MESKLNQLIHECLTPHKEFTPIPFWFLNDELDRNKLKMQLEDFKEKGVDGVVIHPRIGIPKSLEYLSDDYFDIMRYIVETASLLDMKIVLYDEGMYPSGSAHGKVVEANPDFASQGITLTEDPGDGKIIAFFKDGKYLVEKKSGGTIRGIHFGEDDGEPDAPLAADILNPDAVDKFIELVHEKHYIHLKEYFGNTVIGIFTDEPCPLGRNTENFFEWTKGLEYEIEREGGKVEELRSLFEGSNNATTEIYKKLIRNRLNHVYYKKLYDWSENRGIMLMGHPAKSDDIDEEMYFHIPGQDLIFRLISPEEGGIHGLDSVQAKCSSDAARHMGRRRNSNECFGVCSRDGVPWYLTGSDMKWYIDWLGVRGVNLFIPHAFYYSLRGKRKDERPPDVGPNNIWWEHYKKFSDYMKRVSYLMTDSKNCANIAILCESREMPYKEVAPFYENQIEFNYLTRTCLQDCKKEEGKLKIGDYEYSYVIDSKSEHLEDDVMNLIETMKRDFYTKKSYPGLRVTHLIKQGIDMYFVFNEGDEEIDTEVSVPVVGEPVFVDLWKGEFYKKTGKISGNSTDFNLQLGRYETVLIVIDGEGDTKIPDKKDETFIGNISNLFQLVDHNEARYTKTYMTTYDIEQITGNESFEVNGEEMAECFCNGVFAGVSFFPPHKFRIGNLINEGKNEIKIMMTGNIANKYSDKKIPYGIDIGR